MTDMPELIFAVRYPGQTTLGQWVNCPGAHSTAYVRADLAAASQWRPIETAPIGKTMFVAIGVTNGNDFTAGRPYTTDPWCVWQMHKGTFKRWPHAFDPTHWMPLPEPPR